MTELNTKELAQVAGGWSLIKWIKKNKVATAILAGDIGGALIAGSIEGK